ncbi:MAG: glycosyltransferase [Opitutales bacterium]
MPKGVPAWAFWPDDWRELPARGVCFGLTLCALLGLCAWAGFFLGARVEPNGLNVFLGAGTVLMTVLWALWPEGLSERRSIAGLFVLAIVLRALLWPHPPSDDVNRYLWEGLLVREGLSPYAAPAEDARFATYHASEWYPEINHKERLTAYPPLSLLAFAVAGWIDEAVWPLKLLFIAADLGTLALLLSILRGRGVRAARAVFYAANPLVLLMFAGEAHFDSLLVLAMLAAVSAQQKKPGWLAWVCWALAVQVKVIAVLLAPLFLRKGQWRSLWAALPVLLLPTLPFLGSLEGLLAGLAGFGGSSAHNGSVHAVLRWIIGNTESASLISAGLLAGWALVVIFRIQDGWRASMALLGGLLILSPIVHPWYIAWIVPWFVLLPGNAWWWALAVSGLYYTAWANQLAGGPWAQPAWVAWLVWLPFSLLLLLEARHALRRLLKTTAPNKALSGGLSVVIPALNEAASLKSCIENLDTNTSHDLEIIVVDGGSTDDTLLLAEQSGARVLKAGGGRGGQIAAGVAAARFDRILVLHADARVMPGLVDRVQRAFDSSPEAAGGAVGGQHATGGSGPALVLVDFLNRTSALFGRLTLGNQGQFFDRRKLALAGGFPSIPLMEDTELALRLREAGPVLFLDGGVRYADRRYQSKAFGPYLSVAVRLILGYRVARFFGRADAQKCYEKYYGKTPEQMRLDRPK